MVSSLATTCRVQRIENRGKETHANNCRILADIASLVDRFVNGEVFHLRGTEDDICVGFCHRGNILIRRSVKDQASETLRRDTEEIEESQKEGNGRIHMGFCALGLASRSSFTSVVASSLRHVYEEVAHLRDSVPIEYT